MKTVLCSVHLPGKELKLDELLQLSGTTSDCASEM